MQARDITRLSYNTNFLQPDVTFSDGYRSFKGRDKYKQDMWPRAALKQPKGVRAAAVLGVVFALGSSRSSSGFSTFYSSGKLQQLLSIQSSSCQAVQLETP